MADSHGRRLGEALQDIVCDNVLSYVKPGARFSAIVDSIDSVTENMSVDDTLVVVAGTNNISNTTNEGELLAQIEVLMEKTKHTNTIIASLPVRHDSPRLNHGISQLNRKLYDMAAQRGHVKILPLHIIPRYYHTTHGLHFNWQGKKKIAREIAKLLHESELNLVDKLESIEIDRESMSMINVKNRHMDQVIHEFRHRTDTAFSHCISADISSERHMTAGVAVVIGRHFGKPTSKDIVGSHLSYQQNTNEAAVYGLITKPKYFDKPTTTDYNCAFAQLTQHFASKGFTHLICSPMGCVRDKIYLKHFIDNLKKFQRATEARVTIVTYNQKSSRTLFNGLNYLQFYNEMKTLVHNEQYTHSKAGTPRSTLATSSVLQDNHCEASLPGATCTPQHELSEDPLYCPSSAEGNLPNSTVTDLVTDVSSDDTVPPFLERLDIFPPLK